LLAPGRCTANGRPASRDEEAAEGVDDEGHIDKARPGRHVGRSATHSWFGSLCGNVAVDQVSRPSGGLVRRGSPAGLAAADPFQAQLAHQPLHGAASHGDSFAVQLPPDLAGAVDAEVLGVDPGDLGPEPGVADGSRRSGSAVGIVVAGRGDRQNSADRLDPEPEIPGPVQWNVWSWLAGRTAVRAATPRAGGSRSTRHARRGHGGAGTCRAGSAPGAGFHHVRAGPAQVPHGLLSWGGNADGDQLARAVQPRQPATVPPVGLDLIAGCPGDQRPGRSPGSPPPFGATAGPVRPLWGRPRSRLVAAGDRQGNQRACGSMARRWRSARRQGPADQAARPDRDGVLVDVQAEMDGRRMQDTSHGRLLPYGGSARPVWATHTDADWSRPLHAD
jgi:hypothetical protein